MGKMGISEYKLLEPNNLVKEVIEYIESELPNFTVSTEYLNILIKKRNENQYSLSFCVFMTNKCKSKFYFARENSQKGSHTVDIGVYYGGVLIFLIEAKILPTPNGSKKKVRNEYEYVYGTGAGIQRFKDGVHGLDNNDIPLKENGLLAYIKKNDFDNWFIKINDWIADAQWNNSEKLTKIYFGTIGKLRSTHYCSTTNSDIILHHFWINVH